MAGLYLVPERQPDTHSNVGSTVMQPIENRFIHCPYCGEQLLLFIDCSAGSQQYIEDCQVCCRPINIAVDIDQDDIILDCYTDNE